MEGIAYSVEATAATRYEAVALGLSAIRGNGGVMEIAKGFNVVRVRVTNVPVEHAYFATSTFPLSKSSGHAIMALTSFGLRLTASWRSLSLVPIDGWLLKPFLAHVVIRDDFQMLKSCAKGLRRF